MSEILKGSKAVKINSDVLTFGEANALFSREGYIYLHMLNHCQKHLETLAAMKNIDILEYNSLFSLRCSRFEKLFYSALRTKAREKMHDDQVKEFAGNYLGIYHPHNPYLQKYHGAYLRTYQLF
jgi:GR25 family glycosyltransferase involved in LPS biosynthesis